jgi:hypothetical protein
MRDGADPIHIPFTIDQRVLVSQKDMVAILQTGYFLDLESFAGLNNFIVISPR